MGGHITTGLGHHRRHRTALARHGPDGPPRGRRRGALAGRSLARPIGHARLCPHGAARRNRPRSPAAPISIHIHQQPGEDAEALARRVMQLIDREKRASGRFADDFDT
jgi:hypothetical protein